MNKKKFTTMLVAMGLVGIVGVGGTLAWLSASTNEVVNTFAIGPGYTYDNGTTKLDIRENLVWRDSATGVFNKLEDQVTSDGETVVNGKINYAPYSTEDYTNVNGEITMKKDSGTTEGINYEGVVPYSSIPKNPHVAVSDEKIEGIVNSRVYIRVEGLDTMDAIAEITGMDPENWIKVMDLKKNAVGQFTNDSTKLDGYYLYVGSKASGVDSNSDGTIKGNGEESIILSSDFAKEIGEKGTGLWESEDLFTNIKIDNITETELKNAAENSSSKDMLHNIETSAVIIQSDNVSLDDSNSKVFDLLDKY